MLFLCIFQIKFDINSLLNKGVDTLGDGIFQVRTFLENPKYFMKTRSDEDSKKSNSYSSNVQNSDLPNTEKDTNSENKKSLNEEKTPIISPKESESNQNPNSFKEYQLQNKEDNFQNQDYNQNDQNQIKEKITNNQDNTESVQSQNEKGKNYDQEHIEKESNQKKEKNNKNQNIKLNEQPQNEKEDIQNQKYIQNDQSQNKERNEQNQKNNNDNKKDQEQIKLDQPQENAKNDQIIKNENEDQQKEIESNPKIDFDQLEKESKDENYTVENFTHINSILYEITSPIERNPPRFIRMITSPFNSMKNIPAGKKDGYWIIHGQVANFTINFDSGLIRGIELIKTDLPCEIKYFQVIDAVNDIVVLNASILKYPVHQFQFPSFAQTNSLKIHVFKNFGDKTMICLRNYSLLAP